MVPSASMYRYMALSDSNIAPAVFIYSTICLQYSNICLQYSLPGTSCLNAALSDLDHWHTSTNISPSGTMEDRLDNVTPAGPDNTVRPNELICLIPPSVLCTPPSVPMSTTCPHGAPPAQ